jgi:crotonobetainyl-CoA:carnitine CoA-transferase CaiB-like acyl-CoA transferase
MGGLMSITGAPGEGPMRVGIPIADLCAGLFAAQGIFIALLERAHSDQGQWVQTSLLQAQMFMLDFQAARYLMDGDIAKQAGNNHPTSIPTGVFVTSDGYLNIAVAGELIWERFAAALGHQDWIKNPDYATGPDRSKNRDKLNAAITAITGTKTTAEWIDILNKAGVPAGEINNIGQAFENPQVKHLGLAQSVKSHERGDTHLVGQPIMMSRTPSHLAAPPPLAGSHGDDILSTLGYSAAEIAALREEKII